MASASSHWSTSRTLPAPRGMAASASIGRLPGVITRTLRPSRSRAAATPARARDDLPLPEGPTMAKTPAASKRSRHAAISASRPKYAAASETS